MRRAEHGDDYGLDAGAAYTVMLGWHFLVFIAYIVILDLQSTVRVWYDNSPFEDMLILGVNTAPALLGTLLVGLLLVRSLLASRISSAVVLGTAAASPMFLLVGAVTVMHLR
ncbi:hypothetical protein [Micromonospora sp. NPDC092111]|uniref:hypothetical protein n=1 Tax=Micromonospora sp. NPDC092111 TaxID=3364289 RepID=UPI00380BB430